jgi:DNA-binding winged helix-turn-helix (wHTH) protein
LTTAKSRPTFSHMGEVATASALRLRQPVERLYGGPSSGSGGAGLLEAQLRALQSATTVVAQIGGVEQVAPIAAAAARDGIGAEVLVIALLDEDGRHLRPAPVAASPSEARQRFAAIPADGPSLLARVARSGQPIYQQPSRMAHPRPAPAGRPGDESIAALPLPAIDAALGVIVFSRSGDRGFSEQDIAFLNVLAGLCALAVERLRLSTDRSHVREILRRRQLALRLVGTQLRVGRMRIDLEHLEIEIDGRSAHLTPTEMRLLVFLAEEPGRPRTRREILRHLWQTDYVGGERACDAHIWNLRRKVEQDPSRPELVVTSRGVGYALKVS